MQKFRSLQPTIEHDILIAIFWIAVGFCFYICGVVGAHQEVKTKAAVRDALKAVPGPKQRPQLQTVAPVTVTTASEQPEPTPSPTPVPAPVPTSTPLPAGSHQDWMTAPGIDPANSGYVYYIVSRESSWNPNAVNPNGGACGLGQQLPCGNRAGAWNNPFAALSPCRIK